MAKATKASVLRLAKKLGVEVEFERDAVSLIAPAGMVIGDYMHYSTFEFDTPKSTIWEQFEYELSQIRPCESTTCECSKLSKACA